MATQQHPKPEPQPANLSRIPQSFTFDINAIDRVFDEEAPIIRDIIVFAARTKMRNLWGEITFTIDDFCKEFNHNRTNLQRTLKKFENTAEKNLPIIPGDTHVWDGLFEHSLYRAMKENIIISRKRKDRDEIESFQIIEQLTVHYKNKGISGKRERRIYTVKVSDKLLQNLINEYFLFDYNDYRGLSSSKLSNVGGYRNFYLYMARMIATMKYENKQKQQEPNDLKYLISVDDMCNILNINYAEPRDRKKHVKKTLDYLAANLKNTPFTWEFTKQQKRFPYFISFNFPNETLAFFDERLKSVFISSLISELKWEYIRKNNPGIVGLDLVKKMKTISKDDFLKWFFLPDNREEKDRCFKETYVKVYHSEYPHEKIDFELLKLEK